MAACWACSQPAIAEAGARGRRRRLLSAGLLAAAAAMMASCLYLSFSFGAVIGLAAGCGLAGALALAGVDRRHRPRLCVRLAVAVGCGALCAGALYRALPERQRERARLVLRGADPSAPERQLHWRTAYGLFRGHPWVGIGYGAFRIQSLERMAPEWYSQRPSRAQQMLLPGYAHNEVLQTLCEMGVPGGLAFLGLLGCCYWTLAKACLRERDAGWRAAQLGLVAAVTALVVQNQFAVTFHQTGAVTLFWLWLGTAALSGARREGGALAIRELRLRRLSGAASVAAAAALLAGLVVLAWVVARPMAASRALLQARLAVARQDWPTAAQLAERTLQLCPYSAIASYLAGCAWDAQGEQQKAVSYWERSLDLLPGNAMIHYNLGLAYARLTKLAQAERHYRRAATLMPSVARHHAALARVLVDQGKLAEARRLF